MKRLLKWPFPNLYVVAAIMLVSRCLGCDDNQQKAKYPPPTLKGTGTVYVFQGKDRWGNDRFHAALTQWLADHREARLVSIEEINSDRDGRNYLVVVEYPPQQVPPNPPPPDPNQPLEN